ncbi:hypothetical protein GCM10010361_64560 [Streptomyces olivaceiscleroticus]|uniref:Transposase putative helix-turn-helix domain-containing protein n=1 Tax=Streptomyces olivaceiscleroticus TaxID=68245 RepID=A0ABN1B506_9ACTN
MLRAFKYRFHPTDEQAAELSRTFGCIRKVTTGLHHGTRRPDRGGPASLYGVDGAGRADLWTSPGVWTTPPPPGQARHRRTSARHCQADARHRHADARHRRADPVAGPAPSPPNQRLTKDRLDAS